MYKRIFRGLLFFAFLVFTVPAYSQEGDFSRYFILSNNIKTIVAHDSAWHDATQDISGVGGPETTVNDFISLFDAKGNLQVKSSVPKSRGSYADLSKSMNYDQYYYNDTVAVRHEKVAYGQLTSLVKTTVLNGRKSVALTYGKDTTRLLNKDSFVYDTKGRLYKWFRFYYKFGKPIPKHLYEYRHDSAGRVSTRISSEWDGKWLAYTTYYYYDSKGRETEFGDVENGYFNRKYTVKYDDSRNISNKVFYDKDKESAREIGIFDNHGNLLKQVHISNEEGRWIATGHEYEYNSKNFRVSQVNYSRIAKKKEIPELQRQSIDEIIHLLSQMDLKVYEKMDYSYSFYK